MKTPDKMTDDVGFESHAIGDVRNHSRSRMADIGISCLDVVETGFKTGGYLAGRTINGVGKTSAAFVRGLLS